MKILKATFIILLFTSLLSCENEVDINADFTEVTSVIGLVDLRTDTQFVKITRTFLDDEQNAIQLAGQPDRIYYDSLDVRLIRTSTNEEIVLQKITLPKDPGLFTQDRNESYFTSVPLTANAEYQLKITKPDGSITSGKTVPSNGAIVTLPRASVGGKINLVSFQDKPQDTRFAFRTTTNIGEFNVTMRFNYVEVSNNVDSITKFFDVPFNTFRNLSLESKEFIYILDAERFFSIFESSISVIPDNQSELYRFMPEKNITLIIEAADGEYALYRDVNGPIDGLAQVRPEFTNVTNGIGIFASRTTINSTFDLNGFGVNYIHANYGKTTGGAPDVLATYRGFIPRRQ